MLEAFVMCPLLSTLIIGEVFLPSTLELEFARKEMLELVLLLLTAVLLEIMELLIALLSVGSVSIDSPLPSLTVV